MSVSELIERKDVREALDLIIPPYRRAQQASIQVPPPARGHSLIGTAFDYALRLELQRRCPHARGKAWIAEASVQQVERRLVLLTAARTAGGEGIVFSSNGEPISYRQLRRIAARGRRRVENARIFARKHAARRHPDQAWMARLAEHALRLARLDPIFRAGYLGDEVIAENTPEQIEQIVALLGCTPFGALVDSSAMQLNPTFGAWSSFVGGADADLLAGGRLIDVKVTAAANVERSMVRQLVAYLILAERARRDGASIPRITSLEIYFARHGHRWSMEADRVRTNPAYPDVERRFLEIAAQVNRPSGLVLRGAPVAQVPMGSSAPLARAHRAEGRVIRLPLTPPGPPRDAEL